MFLHSRPSGAGKPNEDYVAAAVGTLTQAVLLDGAGGPSELPTGCRHGTPWYVAQLGDAAMGHMRNPVIGLDIALLRSISWVARSHRDHTCDLDHPGTPSSTAVMVRLQADQVEYLVLGDSALVADVKGEVVTVTDRRVEAVGDDLWQRMAALATGTPEHQAARIAFVEHQRRMRNHPLGYPIASVDEEAAREALTGSFPLGEVRCLALLSDGAARFVEFGLGTFADLLDILGSETPWRLFDEVRAAETSDPDGKRWPRAKRHDDISVVYLPSGEIAWCATRPAL
ncbi:protein phosphatase 2C domain-containing protein [Nonomuraea insulae]|uniref:Protein phosphatase 2C domain-containing protein n=1 Tax=Nonomuraea insulae TaxID=1616787 RepID=A0ABW1CE78_9ACTN